MIDADAIRPNEWGARAHREAAAILDGMDVQFVPATRDTLLGLMAIAWLQGVNLGAHETLHAAEDAFENVRAAL